MFAQYSQDVSAENLISEVRETEILQLFANVSTEIAVFQNSKDVSLSFLTFVYWYTEEKINISNDSGRFPRRNFDISSNAGSKTDFPSIDHLVLLYFSSSSSSASSSSSSPAPSPSRYASLPLSLLAS